MARKEKILSASEMERLKKGAKELLQSTALPHRSSKVAELCEFATFKQIANAIGKSTLYVSQLKRFHFFPITIRQHILNKEITLSEVIAISSDFDHFDPKYYDLLTTAVKARVEERKNEKVRKKKLSSSDLKRIHRYISYVQEHIEEKDKLTIIERQVKEIIELVHGDDLKDDFIDKLESILNDTKGRK